MIVVENNSASAAYSLYNETEGIELTTCLMMTNYVEKLPIEMPMGMSERRFKKYLRKQKHTYRTKECRFTTQRYSVGFF